MGRTWYRRSTEYRVLEALLYLYSHHYKITLWCIFLLSVCLCVGSPFSSAVNRYHTPSLLVLFCLGLQSPGKSDESTPSRVGMQDRSRVVLCTFTFLFLSMNPFSALMNRVTSGTAAMGTAGHAGTGRNMLGLQTGGTVNIITACRNDPEMGVKISKGAVHTMKCSF